MLGERTTSGFQVVALDEEHAQRVKFIEGVEYSEKITRVSMGCDGQKVSQSGRQEGVELLLRENLEKRRLLIVEGATEGCDEFHCSYAKKLLRIDEYDHDFENSSVRLESNV